MDAYGSACRVTRRRSEIDGQKRTSCVVYSLAVALILDLLNLAHEIAQWAVVHEAAARTAAIDAQSGGAADQHGKQCQRMHCSGEMGSIAGFLLGCRYVLAVEVRVEGKKLLD